MAARLSFYDQLQAHEQRVAELEQRLAVLRFRAKREAAEPPTPSINSMLHVMTIEQQRFSGDHSHDFRADEQAIEAEIREVEVRG